MKCHTKHLIVQHLSKTKPNKTYLDGVVHCDNFYYQGYLTSNQLKLFVDQFFRFNLNNKKVFPTKYILQDFLQ